MYSVKEAFYTLQGEGAQAGRASVFCRFTGCNLWSGRERDRADSQCTFCDTDFVGTDGQNGGQFNGADALASHLEQLWPTPVRGNFTRYVVFTGGEPLLQLDTALIDAMHARGFEIAVETNGTIQAPEGIDWICVSPKSDTTLRHLLLGFHHTSYSAIFVNVPGIGIRRLERLSICQVLDNIMPPLICVCFSIVSIQPVWLR